LTILCSSLGQLATDNFPSENPVITGSTNQQEIKSLTLTREEKSASKSLENTNLPITSVKKTKAQNAKKMKKIMLIFPWKRGNKNVSDKQDESS